MMLPALRVTPPLFPDPLGHSTEVGFDGYRKGSRTDCLEPVKWIGRRQVGNKKMPLWSCEGQPQPIE